MTTDFKKYVAVLMTVLQVATPLAATASTFQHQVSVPGLVVTDTPSPIIGSGPVTAPVAADLLVSTGSLSFPGTVVGATSSLSVSVTNIGTAPVTLNISTGSAVYSTRDNCSSLDVNATCVITVDFVPSAGLEIDGTLSISPLGSTPSTVALTGLGLGAALQFSTSAVDFGSVSLGAYTERSLSVTNAGNRSAALAAPVLTSGYTLSSSSCTDTLAVASNCSLVVKFSPALIGAVNGSLTLTANQGAGNTTTTAALNGVGQAAHLSLSTSSVPFAPQTVGSSSTQTLTITNSGNTGSALTLGGLSAPFSLTTGCGSTLSPGASCTATLSFAPTEAIAYSQALTVTGSTDILNVTLSGTGEGPQSTSLPATVAVGSSAVGVASHAIGVTLTNTGASVLSVGNAVTTSPFSASSSCPANLAVGASCTINVSVTPQAYGAVSGTLTVVTGAGNQTAALSATGLGDFVTADRPLVQFGSVAPGFTGVQTLTLSNAGNIPAALNAAAPTAPFSFGAGSTCSSTLAPAASCSVVLVFSPSAVGSASQTFHVSVDGQDLAVGLEGTGNAGSISVSSTSLDFSSVLVGQSPPSRTLSVYNSGTVDVSLNSLTTTGDYQASTSCDSTLVPGASCPVQLTFSPSMMGSRSGVLSVNTSAGLTSVNLTGIGLQQALLTSQSSLNLGSVPTGTTSTVQQVNVYNSGNTPVTGISITNDGPFQVVSSCPATLAVQTSCALNVTANPTAAVSQSGTLTIASNAYNSPTTVALTVTGTGAFASVSDLALGTVGYGANALTGSATVTNTGNSALTLTGVSGLSAPLSLAGNTCQSVAAGATCVLTFSLSSATLGNVSQAVTTVGASLNTTFQVSGRVQGNVAQWSPSSLNLGSVYTGQSVSATATLSNTGNAVADYSTMTGLVAGISADASSCTAVAPQSSCQVKFIFAPTTKGSYYAATVQPVGNANTQYNNGLSLSATGLQDGASLSSSSLSFGNVTVGSSSAAQSVSLLNTGNTVLSVGAVQTTGAFTATTSCGSFVDLGGSCTVQVAFAPSTPGIQYGSVTISTAAGTQTIAVSGFSVSPLTASLSSSFTSVVAPTGVIPDTVIGSSVDTTYYVMAGGNVGLLNIGATLTGSSDFQIVSAVKILPYYMGGVGWEYDSMSCGTTISANSFANCAAGSTSTFPVMPDLAITVRYAPSGTAGVRAATLSVTHNGSNTSPIVLPLSSHATGAPAVQLSTSTLAFDPTALNASQQLAVRLTNSGTDTLVFSSAPALVGDASYSFASGGGTTCAASLSPGAYCDTSIVFTPTVQGPASAASLNFASNVSGSPTVVTLTGTGLRGYGTLSAANGSSANFGAVAAGSSASNTFTFTNTGNQAVSGVSASVTPGLGLSIMSNTCGTSSSTVSVGAGASCSSTVQYAPTVAQTLTGASLKVTSSAVNSPTLLALSGTGLLAVPSLSTATLGFSDTNVGDTTKTLAVVLTNVGNTSMTLGSIALSGANASMYGTATNCAVSLAAGAYCTTNVSFTPTAAGAATASLTFTTSGGNSTVALSGTGDAVSTSGTLVAGATSGSLNLTPTSLTTLASATSVGLVANSTTAATSTSVAWNAGTHALSASFAGIPAAGAYAAVVYNVSGAVIATTSVTVASQNTLNITDTSNNALSSIAFGTINVATTRTFRIANASTSRSSIAITGVAPTGTNTPFSIGSVVATPSNPGATCTSVSSMSIPPGYSCDLTVTMADVTAAGFTSGYGLTVTTTNVDSLNPSGFSGTPSSFSIPTTGIAQGASYSLNFDTGAFLTDSTAGSAWSNFGTATQTTSIYRQGTAALALNGSSQGLIGPAINLPADFTISTWVYPTAATVAAPVAPIVTQWSQVVGTVNGYMVRLESGKPVFYQAGFSPSTAVLTAPSAIPANQWTQLTVTRSGSAYALYVNGTSVSSNSSAAAGLASTVPTAIGNYYNTSGVFGCTGCTFFGGEIDQVQIVNGFAIAPSITKSTISASTTAFGTALVGSASGPVNVTLTNGSAAPVTFSSIISTGSSEFAITNAAGCTASTLAPSASCNVVMTFTPSASGSRTGTLTAVSSDASNSPLAVSLTGTGVTLGGSYLVVAGGGGGGGHNNADKGGGGGGAGGVLAGSMTLTGGSYTITVGSGGAGGVGPGTQAAANGASGTSSSLVGSGVSVVASGGGGGGPGYPGGPFNGNAGGSGGGAVASGSAYGVGGSGVSGQGYAGGANTAINNSAGGGGAGAAGGSNTTSAGGNGGVGLVSSITGSAVTYAGGGGGGAYSGTPGVGGAGGGGNAGATTGAAGGAAAANTGGGGGGAGGNGTTSSNGGSGGSGVVIISIPTSQGSLSVTGSTPIITTNGAYTVYTFTASATVTPSSQGAPVGTISGTTAFGIVPVGNSGSTTLTYTNTGGSTASGVTAALANGTPSTVTLSSNTCSNVTLAAGATCSVTVTYTPTTASTLSGAAVQFTSTNTATVSSTLTGASQTFMTANGGTVTHVGNQEIHTFTSGGTFTVTQMASTGSANLTVLAVAGGGGGGGGGTAVGGGGGGAGGVVQSTAPVSTTGAITVAIGAGGTGGAFNTSGTAGGNSSLTGSLLTTITAVGGGRGGSGPNAGSGGSSGGWSGGGTDAAATPTSGQGHYGAAGTGTYGVNNCTGGGGGGAGSAASTGSSTGGAGLASSISGSSVTYAAGGQGGSSGTAVGATQAANTGNGGGGGSSTTGGGGGSGIVVISFQYQ